MHRVRPIDLVAGVSDVFVAHVVQDIVHVGLQCGCVSDTRAPGHQLYTLSNLNFTAEPFTLITKKINSSPGRMDSDIVIHRIVLSTLHARLQGVGAVAVGFEHTRIISTSVHVVKRELFHLIIYVGHREGELTFGGYHFLLEDVCGYFV